MLLAIFDPEPPSELERKARPHWDYGTISNGCAYVLHVYQHTVLELPCGLIY